MTLTSLRSALTTDQPWVALDALIRRELSLGRTTADLHAELAGLVEPVRNATSLTEGADDAMMDALDALIGNCAPAWRYRNEPIRNGTSASNPSNVIPAVTAS